MYDFSGAVTKMGMRMIVVTLVGLMVAGFIEVAVAQQRTPSNPPVMDDARVKQSREKASREGSSVAVVVVDTALADGLVAVVWRRAKSKPQNVVVLSSVGTPDDPAVLAGAISAIQQSRQLLGDDLIYDVRISIQTTTFMDSHVLDLPTSSLQSSWNAIRSSSAVIGLNGMGSARGLLLPVPPAAASSTIRRRP